MKYFILFSILLALSQVHCFAQGAVSSNSLKIHVSTWDLKYDEGSGMSDESFSGKKLKQILPPYISYKTYKKKSKYYTKHYNSTKDESYKKKTDSLAILMDAYVIFSRAFEYINAGNRQAAETEFEVLSKLKIGDYNTTLFYAEYMRKNNFKKQSAVLYKHFADLPKKYDYMTAARFGKMFFDEFNDIDNTLASAMFEKILDDPNYLNQDYNEKIKIIDLVTSCGSSNVAVELLNEMAYNPNINTVEQFCVLGKYFNDNGRQDLAHTMFAKILEADEFKNYPYKKQIETGVFVTNNGDRQVAYSIFELVSDNPAITDIADIYEVARVFETKEFYSLSLKMYDKITEEKYGLSSYLLAQISIADIFYNHPDYDPDKVVFLMYQDICFTETDDTQVYPVLYKACSKTASALNNEINDLIPEYERYERKMENKQKVKSGLNVLTEIVAVAADVAPSYGIDADVAQNLNDIATISTAVNSLVQEALDIGISANDYKRLSIKDKMDFDKQLLDEVRNRINFFEQYKK